MKNLFLKVTTLFSAPVLIISAVVFITMQSCKKETNQPAESSVAGKDPKTLKDFMQVNLVGNNDEYHPSRIDPLLVNAWGVSFTPTGIIWISAEATGRSVIYNKDGNQVLAAVTIPSPNATTGGHPTGQVFNNSRGFRLANGNPARFIFAGADGVISGWNGGTGAVEKVDDSPDASYFGIALARDGADSFLYVANFSEAKIDVYDTAWHEINTKPFMDQGMPPGYSPFNIQNIGNKLYVMYAKLGSDGDEEVGPGNGFVDIYNPDGSLMKRLVSRGQLNAPWGVAKAPASFWGSGGSADITLVGNFGDGHINAFDADGNFLGQLRSHGNPLVIEGLWAISFAPTTATSINPDWLYFTAGPGDETEGLFGYITRSGD